MFYEKHSPRNVLQYCLKSMTGRQITKMTHVPLNWCLYRLESWTICTKNILLLNAEILLLYNFLSRILSHTFCRSDAVTVILSQCSRCTFDFSLRWCCHACIVTVTSSHGFAAVVLSRSCRRSGAVTVMSSHNFVILYTYLLMCSVYIEDYLSVIKHI